MNKLQHYQQTVIDHIDPAGYIFEKIEALSFIDDEIIKYHMKKIETKLKNCLLNGTHETHYDTYYMGLPVRLKRQLIQFLQDKWSLEWIIDCNYDTLTFRYRQSFSKETKVKGGSNSDFCFHSVIDDYIALSAIMISNSH